MAIAQSRDDENIYKSHINLHTFNTKHDIYIYIKNAPLTNRNTQIGQTFNFVFLKTISLLYLPIMNN